jgi:hypothetical protein
VVGVRRKQAFKTSIMQTVSNHPPGCRFGISFTVLINHVADRLPLAKEGLIGLQRWTA